MVILAPLHFCFDRPLVIRGFSAETGQSVLHIADPDCSPKFCWCYMMYVKLLLTPGFAIDVTHIDSRDDSGP